jgi:AcrR family transcriptional regulator
MPRISAARELAVRTRIVEAALRVFARKGFHEATIADVVRESGLSVGAIYTHYRSKDDLFLATCDLTSGQGLGELASRLVRGRSAAEKFAIATAFFLDAMDGDYGVGNMASMLMLQWSRIDADPMVRTGLIRRRDQFTMAGEILMREAIATGELPAWTDAAALANAYLMFLDGLVLWRLEAGASYRREEAERRAYALLRAVVGSAAAPSAPVIPELPASPWTLAALTPEPRRD